MIQFNDKTLETEIKKRVKPGNLSAGLTAKRDLERYYHLLTQALPELTRNEAEAIREACAKRAAWVRPDDPGLLWLQVDDAIRVNGLAEKWGVGEDFGQRLRECPDWMRAALTDAAERMLASKSREVGEFFKVRDNAND